MKQIEPEYWLRGPLFNILPLLQPVVHTLLQAHMEIEEMMKDFEDNLLWQMPAGVASPAFHLQHIVGVLDRLFTYADDKQLSNEQLNYLSKEGKEEKEITTQTLLQTLQTQIQKSLSYLQQTTLATLTETRYVGRNRIPSTQLGLLFHAAEHTMRHTGQLMVTVKIISEQNRTGV